MKILIIDDEPAIRRSFQAFFSDFGHDVNCASDAEEALCLLQKEKYDCAIVDLRLPGISGEVMIQQAYAIDSSLVFFIHTGSIDYELSDELKAIGLDNDNIILKPVTDMIGLLNRIESVVKGSQD